MAEFRQIRREMLAEVGGDMDGLFRAIKAEEAEQIRQGRPVVSLPPPRAEDDHADFLIRDDRRMME